MYFFSLLFSVANGGQGPYSVSYGVQSAGSDMYLTF